MPLALVAALGVLVVGYLVLSQPSSAPGKGNVYGTKVQPGSPGTAGAGRQFAASPIGGPRAPMNLTGQNARPDDTAIAAQSGAQAFNALPALVTAIGTQENTSTRIANEQQLALMKAQPQTNQTAAQSKQANPTFQAPAGSADTQNQFAASSGTVTQDVPYTPDTYALPADATAVPDVVSPSLDANGGLPPLDGAEVKF